MAPMDIQILSKEGLFIISCIDVNFIIEEDTPLKRRENPEDAESISINVETGDIKEKKGKEIITSFYIKKYSSDLKTNSIIFKGSKDECDKKLNLIFEKIRIEDYNINLIKD